MEQNLKKTSFLKSALYWAAFMYAWNTGALFLFQDEVTWKPIVLGIPLWLVGGAGLAYITGRFTKKSNKNA